MEQQNTRLRNAGFATFFFSGICAISAGVVVSLLQERYGFAYGMTGTLLSLMSVGNLLAGLLMGMLPSALGMKRSVLLLTIGYAVGYAIMGLTGAVALLAVAFFVVGIAKGSVINTCTILVSDNSADRTRGMNLMHSCYACGALLCPFLIAAAARVSTELAVFLLAAMGLVLWLVYVFTPLHGHGGYERAVHCVLCAAGDGAHAGRSHRAAVRLCHLDVRPEPHCRGQCGPHDQRDQHGYHAAGGFQRRHPDAVDHRHGGRARRPCRRYGIQHRALRGTGGLCHSGGKAAGGINKKPIRTLCRADGLSLRYPLIPLAFALNSQPQ